jgi:hypothetical protein
LVTLLRVFAVCKNLFDSCIEHSFVVLKQFFFFLWFLMSKSAIFNFFFCSFLTQKCLVLGFENVLFFFLLIYISLFFVTESQANFFKKIFLNIKTFYWGVFCREVYFTFFMGKNFFVFTFYDLQD